MRGKLDLNQVRTFVTVVQQRGFSAAARAMKLPTSNISRHVAGLEAHLQTRLLERSTRTVRVTEAGQRLYERAEAAFAGLLEVESELLDQQGPLRGSLKLSLPSDFGPRVLGAVVARFCAAHPLIELECATRVDTPRVLAEGLDLAIVFQRGLPRERAVFARKLASLGSCVVAAPALLRRTGALATIAALAGAPCISTSTALEGQPWIFTGAGGKPVRVPVSSRHRVDSGELAKLAALAGIGYAILTRSGCRHELEEGTLVEVPLDLPAAPLDVVALYPSRLRQSRKVKLLLARLEERLRALEPLG